MCLVVMLLVYGLSTHNKSDSDDKAGSPFFLPIELRCGKKRNIRYKKHLILNRIQNQLLRIVKNVKLSDRCTCVVP
jgi:hypothetical protein